MKSDKHMPASPDASTSPKLPSGILRAVNSAVTPSSAVPNAILGATSSNFTNSNYCGACVQIINTNNGKSVTATVIDECDRHQPCLRHSRSLGREQDRVRRPRLLGGQPELRRELE